MAIWCADAGGEPGKPTREQINLTKITGPNKYSKTLEAGHCAKPAHTCQQHDTIPLNTWKRAPETKREKHDKKQDNDTGETNQKQLGK